MAANVESMMYTKEVPWHGLGTYVGEEPVLAEEAIKQAGLDWNVAKVSAIGLYEDGDTTHECVTDEYYLNVRTSDKRVLGCVQGKYTLVQNSEAFEFMDALAGPSNLVRYHTAGSLHGGKHIWMLAEVTGLTIEPVPGDPTTPYVLLVNGHDGRMPLKALFTSVRVVCQNTLNLALESGKNGVTIRHTGDISEKAKAAQTVLGFAQKEVKRYGDIASYLSTLPMKDAEWHDFLKQLLPLPDGAESSPRRDNTLSKLTELRAAGPGADIPGVRGTRWGALQAVTDFNSHHRTTRGAKDDPELHRAKLLESTWFGAGDSLNQRALRLLVDA